MNASSVARRSDARPSQPVTSPAVPLLCGLAWLGTALGFAYLDRRFGRFGTEALFLAAWGAVGFGAGAVRLQRGLSSPSRVVGIMAVLTILCMLPGFLMFSFVRWVAIGLMLVAAARASGMHMRRELHLCLAIIVAVSLLVAVHGSADWTIWFYLAPSWVFVALALAWDHAAGVRLPAWSKLSMTLAFMAIACVIGLASFRLAPYPHILGFGFLPPATAAEGRFKLPAGTAGGERGETGREGEGGQQGNHDAAPGRQSPGPLGAIISGMRANLADETIPGWQRSAIQGLLGIAQMWAVTVSPADLQGRGSLSAAEQRSLEDRVRALQNFLLRIPLAALLALAAWFVWRRRWRIGVEVALVLAATTSRLWPTTSLRSSALAARWLLHGHGHLLQPGQSLREHVSTSPLPHAVRDWLLTALRGYGAWRHGQQSATPALAEWASGAVTAAAEATHLSRRRKTA